ncbi:hypothetical protein [Flectobacillus roseus]|jgi:hypothetical protein|uniref:Lipoprotein n=1 Tax=Flectobacillus roseus TaxID=502259 RepID=A0ABT6Y854_9BACT|nr:hypothetical protein [Flectobacillus roseus]MDI9859740.1 hypothetical protein [Flectobacillus roseus]MDI9871998.1 hypothetical protein [Flectobacillus roseus]
MKSYLLSTFVIFLLFSCGSSEADKLREENRALKEQLRIAQNGGDSHKYILKLRLKQSHLSLSIKKHIKDAMNAVDFEIPVDKEFYDSVEEGQEIIDNFRFGSMVLYGSFGDWEMKVKKKYVK